MSDTAVDSLLPVISVLATPPSADVAGVELFGTAVLARTANALRGALPAGAKEPVIVCWNDQEARLASLGLAACAVGARPASDAALNRYAVATRWDVAWRSALGRSAWFDRGFSAARLLEVLSRQKAGRILYVDAASPFLNAGLIADLIGHAEANAEEGLVFSAAVPGLSCVIFSREFIKELAVREKAGGVANPGNAIHYRPDTPAPDPLTAKACAPAPLWATRARLPFRVDSESAAEWWRGALPADFFNAGGRRMDAALAARLAETLATDRPFLQNTQIEIVAGFPATRATFRPAQSSPPRFMPVETFRSILATLPAGALVTLAGDGEPLAHPEIAGVLAAAEAAGTRIAIRTDLAGVAASALTAVCDANAVEILQPMLPASSRSTYARVMGADTLPEVLANLSKICGHPRVAAGSFLVNPVFVKTRENLHEMEPWYDHWLRVLGTATITGPSDRCGQIAETAVADMAPPTRFACRRLRDSIFVTAEGRTTPCDEPISWPMEIIEPPSATVSVPAAFKSLSSLRSLHVLAARSPGSAELPVPCSNCRQWFRAA